MRRIVLQYILCLFLFLQRVLFPVRPNIPYSIHCEHGKGQNDSAHRPACKVPWNCEKDGCEGVKSRNIRTNCLGQHVEYKMKRIQYLMGLFAGRRKHGANRARTTASSQNSSSAIGEVRPAEETMTSVHQLEQHRQVYSVEGADAVS